MALSDRLILGIVQLVALAVPALAILLQVLVQTDVRNGSYRANVHKNAAFRVARYSIMVFALGGALTMVYFLISRVLWSFGAQWLLAAGIGFVTAGLVLLFAAAGLFDESVVAPG